jgi:hypothetical protein
VIDSEASGLRLPYKSDRGLERSLPKPSEARAMAGREEEDAGKCGIGGRHGQKRGTKNERQRRERGCWLLAWTPLGLLHLHSTHTNHSQGALGAHQLPLYQGAPAAAAADRCRRRHSRRRCWCCWGRRRRTELCHAPDRVGWRHAWPGLPLPAARPPQPDGQLQQVSEIA